MLHCRTIFAVAAGLALSSAALPLRASAQTPTTGLDPHRPLSQFSVDVWSEDDGLPQNMASAIAQTPDGYLWVGTEEGLVRFDGVRFRVYGPSNVPAFSTSWVTSLRADDDGTLWVGTGGGGLLRIRDDEIATYSVEDGLSHNHVRSIFRDREGVLWVGTNGGGLNRLTGDGIEVVDTDDGLSNDFVLSIAQDSAGSIWAGTVDGLNRLDDNEIRVFRSADGLAGDQVRAVLGARDGALWIGTADGGLSRYHDGEFTTISTEDGLSSDYVTSLLEDAAGALWVGTNGGGLNRVVDGDVASMTSEENLPGNLVLTLAGDREGNLWMGLTGSGLARVRDGMFRNVGRPEGLSADIALALLQGSGGDVWIGTAGGGLNRLDDGEFTTFTSRDGLAHNVVIALEETRAGELWVGSASGGISRVRDGEVRTFGREDGIPSAQVVDIEEDSSGALWLATQGAGLHRWRPGPAQVYSTRNGMPDDFVTAVLEGRDGTIWAGTRNGLARVMDGEAQPLAVGPEGAPSNTVTGLYEDDDGDIWVTTNSGLARVRDGAVTLYDRSIGLFDREMHAVVEDSLGFLWFSANGGIGRIRKGALDSVDAGHIATVAPDMFGRADGLRSAEANGGIKPAILRHSDGSIWFPTMKGVAIADPAQVTTGRPVPAPIMEYVSTTDSTYAPVDRLSLPPASRSLELHFTAPTFLAADELRFRYRLEGFDDSWVDAGDRRVAYYTNVPAGDYRFVVETRRGDDEWSGQHAAMDITLRPHFYETPLFVVLAALGLIGLGVAGYRLRIRRLTRRQSELVRLVEERERTERALRLSEERLRLALEAGRMGTWEWEVETGAITTSPATRRIVGAPFDTIEEVRDRLRAITADEDFQRLEALPSRSSGDRQEFDLHLPIAGEGDETRHIEVRGRVYTDAETGTTRVAGVVADVTESVAAQEELRRREAELRQAQKMEAVGRLAGGVAHDFNNLLTAISGRAKVVLESLSDESEIRDDIEEVHDAARRAANLTQQLLTFSRKRMHRPRLLDLNDLIDSLERMLRRLIREDVRFEADLGAALGQVRADPSAMEQVLLNLVLNAQDAMPEGGSIVVETRNMGLEDAPADGWVGAGPHPEQDSGSIRYVRLSVTDTGHGMTPEAQRQAFEPFFTTKPVGKGTGLGLSTVYGIVQQCGGYIHMETAPDQGTRIDLYLPWAGEAARVPPAGNDPEPPDGQAEVILLVEDETAVRSLVRKILERRGYVVVDTGSPREALEICRREGARLDMLLSDVVMPELSGRELAERVQRIRPEIRILLMSGYNEDEVLRRGVPGSGMDFLQKPFEPDLLARRVREILDAEAVS